MPLAFSLKANALCTLDMGNGLDAAFQREPDTRSMADQRPALLSGHTAELPGPAPQVPLPHADHPGDAQLGEVSRLEQGHEHTAQDGHRVPRVGRHDLGGSEETFRNTSWVNMTRLVTQHKIWEEVMSQVFRKTCGLK